MEKSRSILSGARLSQEFQIEAVNTRSYLVNSFPSLALVKKTPHEVWFGKKPYLAHIRVFGCDYFLHTPKDKRRKMDNKVEKIYIH